MPQLVEYVRGQLLDVGKRRIRRIPVGNGDNFFVAHAAVLHANHADGVAPHERERRDGFGAEDEHVQRVAVPRVGAGYKPVIHRIMRRREQDSVQPQADIRAERPQNDERDGRGYQDNEHRLQKILCNRGRDFVDALFYPRHRVRRQKRGQNGRRIGSVQKRNPQKRRPLVGGVGHGGDDVRVNEHAHDGRRQVRVRAEFFARGKGDENGQKVERGVGDGVQNRHRVVFGGNPEIEDNIQHANHAHADDCRNNRRNRAGNRV